MVAEVERLAGKGCLEVVLTGIHLSSYGIDLGSNLLELILAVHQVEGIQRIRLGSLEPRIVTEEFVKTISKLPKICPHFHLSLQSGCDTTLKRMNRRYTTEEYLEKCQLLRRYFSHPAFTTDVIVGFPGESEEEFLETVAFLKTIRFYETHVFKYSRRIGTKAAEMPDQVPDPIKAKRSAVLLSLCAEYKQKFERALIGTETEILFEEEVCLQGEFFWVGHTKEYVKLATRSAENLENRLTRVTVTGDQVQGIPICQISTHQKMN